MARRRTIHFSYAALIGAAMASLVGACDEGALGVPEAQPYGEPTLARAADQAWLLDVFRSGAGGEATLTPPEMEAAMLGDLLLPRDAGLRVAPGSVRLLEPDPAGIAVLTLQVILTNRTRQRLYEPLDPEVAFGTVSPVILGRAVSPIERVSTVHEQDVTVAVPISGQILLDPSRWSPQPRGPKGYGAVRGSASGMDGPGLAPGDSSIVTLSFLVETSWTGWRAWLWPAGRGATEE